MNLSDRMGSFTEKLIPIMNKAEAGIRKGVSSAKDFAQKANEEYIAPTVEKVGESVKDGKAKEAIKKLNPKIIGIAAAALVVIIALIAIIGGGGDKSEKVALRFAQAMIEMDISDIKKTIDPSVAKYIEERNGFDIDKEEAAQIKEMLKEIKISVKIKGHEELDEYDLDDINSHFESLLDVEKYGAKEAVEYTVSIMGRYLGQKMDEDVDIVVIKKGGKWYVAKADGYYIDRNF